MYKTSVSGNEGESKILQTLYSYFPFLNYSL